MKHLYTAKQSGVTEKGSRYSILQDGPTSFHITVQKENNVIYDYMLNPTSMSDLMNLIASLEDELFKSYDNSVTVENEQNA